MQLSNHFINFIRSFTLLNPSQEAIDRGNVVVFFDVVLGGSSDGGKAGGDADGGGGDKGKPLGRIKLELFVNDVSFCMDYCFFVVFFGGSA